MSEKSNKNDVAITNNQSELEQLRTIVFGAAKQSLEARIDSNHNEVLSAIKNLQDHQVEQAAQMQQQFEVALSTLDAKLENVDSHHEDNHAHLIKTTETINSQLEIAEATSKDEVNDLHNRIDKEINKLSSNFDEKFGEAMQKLAQVTHDLTDSKTDRKTLARLLATMASNLETD